MLVSSQNPVHADVAKELKLRLTSETKVIYLDNDIQSIVLRGGIPANANVVAIGIKAAKLAVLFSPDHTHRWLNAR